MERRKSILTIVVQVIAGIAALSLAVVGVAAAANVLSDGKKAKPTGAGTQTPPATHTFDEDGWTIVTPGGWTRSDVTAHADAEKAIRFEGSNGDYFTVAIDPLGSDYTYDALWQYSVDGNGFKVSKKFTCSASSADEACNTSDGRFSGYVMWKTGTTPHKLGGHVWYFMFGNATKTSVDGTVFEQILTSIRVDA
jgi:hypothetical protein